MSAYAKPLPQPDQVTQPYWDGLKARQLRIQRCTACSAFVFYPRPVCPQCFSSSLEWVEVSGRGTLHTFTVVHRAAVPEFRDDVPYVVALVELDEGARLMATLVDVAPDPAAIRVGMPLEIVYDDVTPDITLPRFKPAT